MKLQEIRKKSGLSRVTLAELVGTTRVTIFRWETGKCEPDLETLKHLSKILDCTIDDLIGNPTPAPARKRRTGAGGQ